MKRILAAALWSIVGCIDYTLVGLDPEPPSLDVFAHVQYDERVSFGVGAQFFGGHDGAGRGTLLVDSTIQVNGDTVRAVQSAAGFLFYNWRGAGGLTPVPLPDSMSVRGPVLEGGEAWPRAAMLYLPRHDGPFEFQHVSGDTLSFELPGLPVPSSDTSDARFRWTFQLGDAVGSSPLLSRSGSSARPPAIRIPWGWLADDVAPGDTLNVVFFASTYYDFTSAPYRTSVSTGAVIRWRVLVVASP